MQFEETFEGIGAGPVVAISAGLAIMLGVIGGESIDTTLLQRGKTFAQTIPDPQQVAHETERWSTNPNLPDHYAVETRNGRIEVWELRSYILRHERPPVFDYYGYATDSTAPLASAEEAPADEYDVTPQGELAKLDARTVPGRLEQAALPIGDEVVIEPAAAVIARADAILAELERRAGAWETGSR